MNGAQLVVRRGFSTAQDEGGVARELAEAIADPSAALVLVFASPAYDASRLAAELAGAMAPTPVVGCTTAGEIGPTGFVSGSAVAMSLAAPSLRVGIGCVSPLASGFRSGGAAVRQALAELGREPGELDLERCAGISIIDGRSGQEEVFIAGAASAVPGLRLVGGSASDDLRADPAARIFHGGEARESCGLLVVFETDVPMMAFKSEHMVPDDRRVVVTGVEGRLIHELDGKSALAVYRDILGVSDGEISTELAGRYPFAQYVGGQPYVRSVMGVEGTSLRLACAVDKGVVLRPMRPGDLVAKTAADLRAADEKLGGLGAMVAFSCLGRYFESEAAGSTGALGQVLTAYPVVGFNTFGEQFNALHMNHTLTALAFAAGSDGD